ncbi:MAG: 3-oxoacyl-[acyl-carrier-protein] reductase [Spirochaetes bacterium]|nr:3-oxoacyl-[acyl-carrier-protein] reductase [Spirochaetota bacterium]
MSINLKGKAAVVTGGARGIGKAIVETLSEAGCDIVVADLMKKEAEATAEEIKKKYKNKALPLDVDVSKYDSVEKCVKSIIDSFGKIDILVNNAGVTRDTLMLRMTPEDWDFVINVNLKGTFNFTKVVSSYMMKAKYGRIVNIASIIGMIGNVGQANYSASKGGIIALTKTTAKEFAVRNITCNAVAPGFIETEMTQKLPEKVREEYLKLIPMRKMGTPDDVANVTLFLVSDLANYISGQTIVVDGGMVM